MSRESDKAMLTYACDADYITWSVIGRWDSSQKFIPENKEDTVCPRCKTDNYTYLVKKDKHGMR